MALIIFYIFLFGILILEAITIWNKIKFLFFSKDKDEQE